ncbi:trafficking protein particle complex subunit 11-like protein, partial [Leptotrombidium deliense]
MSNDFENSVKGGEEQLGDIPKELAVQPLPCIAFVGLNLNNKNHLHIWNSFACNRQSDRIPLYYKALTVKNTIIACKPKKSSYEWHIPKGILKSNWLHKHLFEVPSVALLFIDLEWSDPNWETASSECASKVEQLKRQLTGRNTRIALVLVQENLTFPGVDDSLPTERAAHLCSVCDLSPKSLFVLPLLDHQHFTGFVLRMETAIFELAKGYYQYEAKIIKAHKEHLNKTTHQLLFVRHMFKIAFLNEIKQEIQTAIKGYKQAYAYLMEVRVSFTNLLEIKTIAGFINYKICKLSFLQNEPMDAFSQFRKHIDIFKSKS